MIRAKVFKQLLISFKSQGYQHERLGEGRVLLSSHVAWISSFTEVRLSSSDVWWELLGCQL